MSPSIGILAAIAPFNIKLLTIDREVSKTVINQQVAGYDSSVRSDIKLKLALKKFHITLTFETQFKIEFNTTI